MDTTATIHDDLFRLPSLDIFARVAWSTTDAMDASFACLVGASTRLACQNAYVTRDADFFANSLGRDMTPPETEAEGYFR